MFTECSAKLADRSTKCPEVDGDHRRVVGSRSAWGRSVIISNAA